MGGSTLDTVFRIFLVTISMLYFSILAFYVSHGYRSEMHLTDCYALSDI